MARSRSVPTLRLHRPRWRPGTRVGRIRATHSYRWVLLLVAVTFVFVSAAPNEGWARIALLALESATLVTALWTSGLGSDFRPGLVLCALAVVVAVVDLAVGGGTLDGVTWIVNVALVVGTIVVIALGVFDQGEVNTQSVTGAVCIYILLGLVFTYLYGAIAALGTGPFFAQGTDGTPSIRLYFSYVTLATLGYGDYTAAGNLGRTLAVAEALLGQLYLVTVIALLVSNMGRFGKRAAPVEPEGSTPPSGPGATDD
jgi:Ion channel